MKNIKELIKEINSLDPIFNSKKITNEELVELGTTQLTDIYFYTDENGENVWLYEIEKNGEKYHAYANTVMKRNFNDLLTKCESFEEFREDMKECGLLLRLEKSVNKKGQMTYIPRYA